MNKQKRTHSEISSESDTSMDKTIDKSGLLDLHKDLDEIKLNLQGITKKSDLDILTKDLVRTHDLEIVVTNIVNKLLQRFESSIDKKINARFVQVEKEMQETIDALKLENETLRRRSDEFKETIVQQKKTINQTSKLTQEAIISANYNEQYSRKNNIKVMNFPRRENQDLRSDFIKTVKNDLKVELEVRDVVAIHRVPSREPGLNPVLVRLFSSDVKRKIMREKKELKNNIRFSDDVTKRNMELINRLRDMNCFESVWYYNCGVYGITEDGLQLKFGLYDDVHTRLQQESGGAELLFGNQKKHEVDLPENSNPWTIKSFLPWVRDNLLQERPELFMQGETVRPGILVLVNDADWELMGELDYCIQPNDRIVFISTLHGG